MRRLLPLLILAVRRISANTGLVAGVADPVDQFGILLDVHVLVWARARDVMQHPAETFDFDLFGTQRASNKASHPTPYSADWLIRYFSHGVNGFRRSRYSLDNITPKDFGFFSSPAHAHGRAKKDCENEGRRHPDRTPADYPPRGPVSAHWVCGVLWPAEPTANKPCEATRGTFIVGFGLHFRRAST